MEPKTTAQKIRERVLELARAELAQGVREATGRNDGVPSERYSDGRKEAWCANFVTWLFRAADCPLPGNHFMLPSVRYLHETLAGLGYTLPAGEDPPPGAIVVFRTRVGSDKGTGWHCGIVDSCRHGALKTIEGNSGDAVAARTYREDDGRIVGFLVYP